MKMVKMHSPFLERMRHISENYFLNLYFLNVYISLDKNDLNLKFTHVFNTLLWRNGGQLWGLQNGSGGGGGGLQNSMGGKRNFTPTKKGMGEC